MQANRIVVLVTALLGLAAAVLPVAANMDWTSTAGVIGGAAVAAAAAVKWLDGWQRHEDREAFAEQLDPEFTPDPEPPVGDESASVAELDAVNVSGAA